MNLTVKVLDISSNSSNFVLLGSREYPNDYVPLPNANLPKNLRVDLERFFTFLTGNPLPLEENTFLVKANQGVYSRLFGPVLKVGSDQVSDTEPGKLYIQWGPHYIPLTFSKGSISNQFGTELDCEFNTFNFAGRGDDPALLVTLELNDTEQLVLPIAVRFQDWENPVETKILNSLLKKDPEKLLEVLQKASAKKSSSRVEADADVDFNELEVLHPYEVIGYYPCKTSYGVSYRIFIKDTPEEGKVGCAWAHNSIRPLLSTKPEINRENPAVLTLRSKDILESGKTRIRASLFLPVQNEDPEALNLDFV